MTNQQIDQELYKVFEGKSLKENLQDIIAGNNTGYTYDKLQEEIKSGQDLLEDDEIKLVDKTVNLLAHLFKAHQQVLVDEALRDAALATRCPNCGETEAWHLIHTANHRNLKLPDHTKAGKS